MSEITLYKNGKQININEHPSLLAFFHANNRAITRIDDEIQVRLDEIDELNERLELHEELGLKTQGIKSVRTRRKNQVHQLLNRKKAYQKNYLEVPDMDGFRIEDNDDQRWGIPLGTDVPIDALRAMKHAKEQGIFDEFQLYKPTLTDTDPMIVGVCGGRTFYIASWS